MTIIGSMMAALNVKLRRLVTRKFDQGKYETSDVHLVSDYGRNKGRVHSLTFNLTVYMTDKEFREVTRSK